MSAGDDGNGGGGGGGSGGTDADTDTDADADRSRSSCGKEGAPECATDASSSSSSSILDTPTTTEAATTVLSGTVLFSCRLSDSFAFFTLSIDGESNNKDADEDEDGASPSSSDGDGSSAVAAAVVDVKLHTGRNKQHCNYTAASNGVCGPCASVPQPQQQLDCDDISAVMERVGGVGNRVDVVVLTAATATSDVAAKEPCPCGCPREVVYALSVNGIGAGSGGAAKKKQQKKKEEVPNKEEKAECPLPTISKRSLLLAERPNRKQRPNGTYNSARSPRFVDWLVDTFFGGAEALKAEMLAQRGRAGGGIGPVLDVAGGGNSGGVSFELMRRRIPTVIVDPRPVQLTKSQTYTLKFQSQAREKLEKAGKGVSHLADVLSERYQDWWQPTQVCALFDDDFEAAHPLLLEECSVITGMHPDQATDAVVNFALKYRKPFAVCPCCVFPRQFPHRRIGRSTDNDPDAGGGGGGGGGGSGSTTRQVRKYEDLCEYIKSRAPGIREVTLDFAGRNRILYWHPDWQPTG